jgi:serralysin
MSVGTYAEFFTALGQNESGNNYSFVSSPGYLGRFQFGEEALKAIGFYNGDSTSAIDFVGSWTATAASYGVYDKASFLASAAAQDAAGQAWMVDIDKDLVSLGLDKYVGQTVAGVQITTSGLLAGSHLMGVWNVKTWIETGGAVNAADFHGTTISDYVSKFANYDTPFDSSAPSASAGLQLTGDWQNDTLQGGSSADTISGGDGTNVLRGNDGADSLTGGSGFDDINGNVGNDTAHGGGGADWVVGGKDQDALFGDDGDDIVYGNLGNDTLDGGAGSDVVRGGQGDDVMTGGDGNDWLSGDLGSDTLSGGAGADVFHSFAGAGVDRVLDFHASEGDRVMLDAGTSYSVAQVGADTVVSMTGGTEVVLVGVTLSTLPSGWIFEG